MPDTPVAPPGSSPYPADMESRVAVLEQIARASTAASERIERRLDSIYDHTQRRFDALSAEHRADFRWLLALILAQTGALLGVMAHGFHWL